MNPRSPWWGEHGSRYLLACRFGCRGSILDIACGSAFGSMMLAQGNEGHVVGVDIELAEVSPRDEAEHHSLSFVKASGVRLPFADSAFDLVTSFETIEHVEEYEKFVGEIRRVTKKGGQLLLSTPNHAITRNYPANPYHVHEFEHEELRDLLRIHFDDVELLGQKPSSRYPIVPFLPGFEKPIALRDSIGLICWKIANRMPFRIKNWLSLLLAQKPFYPSASDFEFESDTEGAGVLVAICKAL